MQEGGVINLQKGIPIATPPNVCAIWRWDCTIHCKGGNKPQNSAWSKRQGQMGLNPNIFEIIHTHAFTKAAMKVPTPEVAGSDQEGTNTKQGNDENL